jgi:hypothetical protein
LIMKIIPDNQVPGRTWGASGGTRPARHDRRPLGTAWCARGLNMSAEPDMTSRRVTTMNVARNTRIGE